MVVIPPDPTKIAHGCTAARIRTNTTLPLPTSILSTLKENPDLKNNLTKTSTGLYRSCAGLANFSGTFDLILFEAVNLDFIVEKVQFGLVWIDGLDKWTK